MKNTNTVGQNTNYAFSGCFKNSDYTDTHREVVKGLLGISVFNHNSMEMEGS